MASGAMFTPSNAGGASSTNWTDTSVLAAVRGTRMYSFPSAWKIRMRFTAGSPVIGNMVLLTTLAYSRAVIASRSVRIGGLTNPTLVSPGVVDTDVINLQTDRFHDYWFVLFFAADIANVSVSVARCAGGLAPPFSAFPFGIWSVFDSGDKTGVSTVPLGTFALGQTGYLVLGGVLA